MSQFMRKSGRFHDAMGSYVDIIGAQGGYGYPGYGPFGLAIGQADGAQGVPAAPMAMAVPGLPLGGAQLAALQGGWGGGFGPGFAGPGFGPGFGCGPGGMPDPNAVATLVAAREAFGFAPSCPTKAAREILGFGHECIGPCETVSLSAEPQVIFKPYRLVIPSSVAFNFQIHEIKFGKWNLFANGGSVPAAAFIETAEDTDFNGDTVMPSGKITITVQNITNSKVPFTAAMWGKALE